jgi:UDP-N-acetylmuramoylalanine--D-glutamate ligase
VTFPNSVVILGFGAEAAGALKYFSGRAKVFLFDDNPEKWAPARAAGAVIVPTLADLASHAAQAQGPEIWLRAPSMKPAHPELSIALQNNKPVTTFTSYWIAQHRASVLATITGTKGKSTTTSLCGAILNAAGLNVRVGGNIGVVPDAPPAAERWVFETSSYQLHDCLAAAPVHAVTSLYPEHLDWHGSMDAYVAAKVRPYTLDPACVAVLPKALAKFIEAIPNPRTFVEDVVRWDSGELILERHGARVSAPLSDASRARLTTDRVLFHNFSVACVTALLSAALDVQDCAVGAAAALEQWSALPCRQEVIGNQAGRIWVDDALATIPQATVAALERWEGSTVRLILGGKERQQDFAVLADYLKSRPNVSVYLYGDAADRLSAALARPADVASSFTDALERAFSASARADILLFSPAGATPEPGENYLTRSAKFRQFARTKSEE